MLRKLHEAPASGWILGLYPDRMILEAWTGILPDGEPDELHIFDADREYRAVRSQARGGYVEAVITEPTPEYSEEVMQLREDPRKYLTLRQYYAYDAEDLLYLAAYRLTGIREVR